VTPEKFIGLGLVLVLGAISPGPSLALVLRNTMNGGRRHGVLTGIGHGLGFGIYAFLSAAGLAVALNAHPYTEAALRWGGTVILIWLGWTFLQHASQGPPQQKTETQEHLSTGRLGFVQGFLVALFNPKILAWMLAIYAPFVDPGAGLATLAIMGLMGMCIDGTWYVSVAVVLSGTSAIDTLRARAHLIDRAMGVLMFVFAGLLVADVL
jgi:threonine/homoserine/homoserine lactone efflux protein